MFYITVYHEVLARLLSNILCTTARFEYSRADAPDRLRDRSDGWRQWYCDDLANAGVENSVGDNWYTGHPVLSGDIRR